MKVLHVVDSAGVGGVPLWIQQITPRLRERGIFVEWFTRYCERQVVHAAMPDAPWVVCARNGRCWRSVLADFLSCVRTFGPYQAVHINLHYSALPFLLVAWGMKIPIRVVHSRSNFCPNALMRAIGRLSRGVFSVAATHRLAITKEAAADLFGERCVRKGRFILCPSGIDFELLKTTQSREDMRRKLGIDARSRVIIHVGRFTKEKNQKLLIDVLQGLNEEDNNVMVLLVGDGELRCTVENYARVCKVQSKVRFLGNRNDVADLLRVSDVFCLPSLYEGQGRAYIEAQALGLPCVVSDRVPVESDIIPENVRRVPLSADIDEWIRAVRWGFNGPRLEGRVAFDRAQKSIYNIDYCVGVLCSVYQGTRDMA